MACSRPTRASIPMRNWSASARAGDAQLEAMAGGAGSSIGKGGMLTKILAAGRAAGSGASTVIAWGREPDALLRLVQGRSGGHGATGAHAQAAGAQAMDGRSSAVARLRGGGQDAAAKLQKEGRACCQSA